LILTLASYAQRPVDSLEIRKYVDSINILVATWTTHDPELSVDVSGKSQILHKDGSRFIFNMLELKGADDQERGRYHGVNLRIYDPRTRPAEQHFIDFRGTGSDGMIRFEKIPEAALREIYGLCVKLRRLFL
jgi:hypothetical protein